MASENKKAKGVNAYIADLGLKNGRSHRRIKHMLFYTPSERKAYKAEADKIKNEEL